MDDDNGSAAVSAYLERHQIGALFESLCAQLIHQQPPATAAFLIDQLSAMRRDGGGPAPSLYTDDDLDAMFGTIDPLRRGQVRGRDAVQALRVLGIRPDRVPDLDQDAGVARQQFVALARDLLHDDQSKP